MIWKNTKRSQNAMIIFTVLHVFFGCFAVALETTFTLPSFTFYASLRKRQVPSLSLWRSPTCIHSHSARGGMLHQCIGNFIVTILATPGNLLMKNNFCKVPHLVKERARILVCDSDMTSAPVLRATSQSNNHLTTRKEHQLKMNQLVMKSKKIPGYESTFCGP